MKGTGWLIGGLVLVIVGIVGLLLLSSGILPGATAGSTPAARGQWIFQTGTDPSGQLIPNSGGMGTLAPHGAKGPPWGKCSIL